MEGQTRPNIRVKQVVDVVAGTADLVIEVERGLTVTGRVRTQDGSPATDGVVNVYYVATGGKDAMDASEQRSDQFCVSSKVDNGRFEVIGLDPRKVRLSVDARGWLRRTITVDAGAKDILFELIRGGFITGRVLMPDGTPATRAWVRIEDEGDDSDRPRGTRSEADGTFKLNDVTPGVHRVVASCDDDKGNVSVQGDARGIEVQSEKTADGVEIRTRRLP
jgi:hypothetical protein